MNTEKLELARLAERFKVHTRSDGKSPRTVEWYNQSLEVFGDWLGAGGHVNLP